MQGMWGWQLTKIRKTRKCTPKVRYKTFGVHFKQGAFYKSEYAGEKVSP
jgi:hypothetical protein